MPTKKRKHIRSGDNRYERFVRDLKLLGLGLNSSSAKLERPAYAELRRRKKGVVRKVTAVYKLERVESESFDASATFNLTIQDKEAQLTGLVIECVFEAHFYGKKPIEKDLAERFTTSELRVIMWPYFRQFVSDMTSRMAMGTVTLPLEP